MHAQGAKISLLPFLGLALGRNAHNDAKQVLLPLLRLALEALVATRKIVAVAVRAQPIALAHVVGHASGRLAAAVAHVARRIVDGRAAAACP